MVTWLGYLSFFNIVKLAQRKNQTYTYTHIKHMPVTTLKSIHAQHPSIVFVNACGCRCVDTCEYICVEPWDSLDCHSSDVIYLFAILFYFRQCLSLDWNSSSRLCCLSEKPQDSAFRCLPSPETSGVSPHLAFFLKCGYLEVKSRSSSSLVKYLIYRAIPPAPGQFSCDIYFYPLGTLDSSLRSKSASGPCRCYSVMKGRIGHN